MSALLTYQPGGEMLIPCDLHGERAETIPLDGGYACLECAKEAYKNAVRVASQVAALTAENGKLRAEVARLIQERDEARVRSAELEIARLTAECGRLRAERDGLANAVGLFFKAKDLYGEAPPDSTEEHHAAARVEEAVDSMLRAAAAIAHAACAPEVKP